MESINVITHGRFSKEEVEMHGVHCVGENHTICKTEDDTKEEKEQEKRGSIETDVEEPAHSDETEHESENQEENKHASAVHREQTKSLPATNKIDSSKLPEEKEHQHEKVVEEAGTPNTRPAPGDEVIVNYTSFLPDGSPLDNTYTRQNGAYSFTTDANIVTVGFDRAVSSMNLHEKAKFIVPYQLLYGTNGLPGSVPQKANLTFNIHLIQITKQNGHQIKETNQVTVVETETEVESENQHETQTSGVLGIVAELAIETAKNPPSSRPK